jgi:phage terminase large subunit-like protein
MILEMIDITNPPANKKNQLLELLVEKKYRRDTKRITRYYPDTGALRRELYVKHLEFFKAGAIHKERLMLAANRIGKSEGVGGYELTLHLTGEYPNWWEGKRFDNPIKAWAAGDTSKTVRDIIQSKLLGPVGSFGTGLIPKENIISTASKQGIADAIEIIRVRHKSRGESILVLKSYDQRREAFQGTEQDVVWYDEEPPFEIYIEGLMRTMTTGGLVLCTFTPLLGISETVLYFLPGGDFKSNIEDSSKYVVMATWDDAPHLTEEQKNQLFSSIPDYQRDARTKGIPQLGSGAIYPIPESEILVDPFEIPVWYPRSYGMDVGWNRTAAVWGAIDRESDTVYLYSEYYRGSAEPAIHVHGIRARGDWVPGVVDPAARGRGQADGGQLLQMYCDLGLNLVKADNSVESGIYNVWQQLSFGKLKVFKSLQNWLAEYRLYRRDDRGNVVKQNDHLMDATRYLVSSGLGLAECEMADEFDLHQRQSLIDGRSRITGY